MTTIRKPAEVDLPSESEVRITRSFLAPRALVWRAFTDPALVPRWLVGPSGWTMPVCEMDVRVGGRFRWRWRSGEDGSEFGFRGEFLEVEAPARLRHTEIYEPGDGGSEGDMGDQPALVTVTFTADGEVTTVSTLVDYGTRASRDAALSTGMTDGMEMSYRQLDEQLSQWR